MRHDEAEQEDAVARLPVVDDEFVAIGDVALDALPRHRAEQLLYKPHWRGHCRGANVGAKSGVIERDLPVWIDRVVRMVS